MTDYYNKIVVSSELKFRGYSSEQKFYIHEYKIIINNNSEVSFQLLRRHWKISNGMGYSRTVDGDGVIGEQPVIHPGQSFSYSSWSPMPSAVGYMVGYFMCNDLELDQEFQLEVPQMDFVASQILN